MARCFPWPQCSLAEAEAHDQRPTTRPRRSETLHDDPHGEKRPDGLDEEQPGSETTRQKVMAITSSSIEPVADVVTKRGKKVKIETNEEPEWRLDSPLLRTRDLKDWPEDKLR